MKKISNYTFKRIENSYQLTMLTLADTFGIEHSDECKTGIDNTDKEVVHVQIICWDKKIVYCR